MKKIIVSFLVLSLIACSKSNNIYFDTKKKGISSCNGSLISNLIIIGIDDNLDYYRFSLKENYTNGVVLFKVDSIDTAFDILINNGSIISNEQFKLKPLTKYKVINKSNGDFAEFHIQITTDQNGKVKLASSTDCK
jgi:hypothetical protein